jgi:PAS domain S-box-containing protein
MSDIENGREALSPADAQRLMLALEAGNQALWEWNFKSGEAYLAPAFFRMLGFKPGDFPATFDGWTALLHPDDLPILLDGVAALTDDDRFEAEFRLRTRDGDWRWILSRGMVMARDDAGLPTGVIGINLDITERRRAQIALQESEARFRAIFDSVQEAILIHDIDSGAILLVNRRAREMFAMTDDELAAASVQDLSEGVPPYTQADAALWIMRAAAGEPQQFEWHAKDARGRLFWVELGMRRAVIGETERLVAVVRDISARKEREAELRHSLEQQVQLNRQIEDAQNQLLQSEKMASIGQLAAGVAHELNNPIGFVASNLGSLDGYLKDLFEIIDVADAGDVGAATALARVAEMKAAKDYDFLKTDIGQLMAESRDGLSRVRKIVQDLKDFSHVGQADWQWADLHVGLDSTLNIVWNELKYKCKVTKEYGELPQVYCLPSQLNQVFMNLLVNAAQAIETRGEIAIRTGRDGDTVWVEVADTGKGIVPEHLKRIFDPFFTTKPVGKGTGLGLSLSSSIVVKHRGRFEVSSEVGQGSTFRVVLPIKPELEKGADSPK